jgi:N-acetyl-gamma-glutamyl-phosphate reductase
MKPVIFIDGEAGTTGLQIRTRLNPRQDIEILSLANEDRKNPARREEALNNCDVAILCLPDNAARGSVSMIRNPAVRVIDASTAHRTNPEWVYGFPEMASEQATHIAEGARITNPGCYPTGAIALLRPLIVHGLIRDDYPATISAVSGYSGAGSRAIDTYEKKSHSESDEPTVLGYGFALEHKHVPEIQTHSGLSVRPMFLPMIGHYRQGILLSVGLHFRHIAPAASGARVHSALADHYRHAPHIRLMPLHSGASVDALNPEALNDTDDLQIHVFENDRRDQCVVAAVFDNLGKGASGAAVQNLNLMLGLTQTDR